MAPGLHFERGFRRRSYEGTTHLAQKPLGRIFLRCSATGMPTSEPSPGSAMAGTTAAPQAGRHEGEDAGHLAALADQVRLDARLARRRRASPRAGRSPRGT